MIIAGKEVELIKEYDNFILVQYPVGYRECISRFDLGEIKEAHIEKIHGNTGKRF